VVVVETCKAIGQPDHLQNDSGFGNDEARRFEDARLRFESAPPGLTPEDRRSGTQTGEDARASSFATEDRFPAIEA